jgi:magnesium-transporting ATPase (P-type)
MVTGDNLETAIAIAKDAGIIPSHEDIAKGKGDKGTRSAYTRSQCMTGAEFRK